MNRAENYVRISKGRAPTIVSSKKKKKKLTQWRVVWARIKNEKMKPYAMARTEEVDSTFESIKLQEKNNTKDSIL